MPIYPYVCTACGHEFDTLQKFSDEPLKDCPKCQEPRLRKRLTAPSFQLKGTGWYETDFKHGGKKPKSDGKGKGDGAKQSQANQGGGKKEQGGMASGGADSSSKDSAKTGSSDSAAKPAAGKSD